MNKTTIISIISFFLIGLLSGSQMHGCRKGMRGGGGGTLVRADTVVCYLPRTDTVWHTVELTNNIPYTVWGHDTVYIRKVEQITGRDTSWLTQYIPVSDTVAYADTLMQADAFKAELFDTLAGNRIIGRSLHWADLTPVEVKTVKNTVLMKQALVKIFVGADAYGGKDGAKVNLDIAPAASLVIADRYMVDLGYYIFDQQLTVGMKVKLSFRR